MFNTLRYWINNINENINKIKLKQKMSWTLGMVIQTGRSSSHITCFLNMTSQTCLSNLKKNMSSSPAIKLFSQRYWNHGSATDGRPLCTVICHWFCVPFGRWTGTIFFIQTKNLKLLLEEPTLKPKQWLYNHSKWSTMNVIWKCYLK